MDHSFCSQPRMLTNDIGEPLHIKNFFSVVTQVEDEIHFLRNYTHFDQERQYLYQSILYIFHVYRFFFLKQSAKKHIWLMTLI